MVCSLGNTTFRDILSASPSPLHRHDDYSAEEWKNVALFLRQLYSVGDDMMFLSKGFNKEKKEKAAELVKRFQDRLKKAAPAADKKDWEVRNLDEGGGPHRGDDIELQRREQHPFFYGLNTHPLPTPQELLAVQKDTFGDLEKFFDLLIDAPEDL